MKAGNFSDKNMSTLSRKESYWHNHLEAWKVSGLLKTIYCNKHSLNYSRFMYWQKKLKEDKEVSFVPVKIKSEPNMDRNKLLCTVSLANGALLNIHDEAALEIILTKLK